MNLAIMIYNDIVMIYDFIVVIITRIGLFVIEID